MGEIDEQYKQAVKLRDDRAMIGAAIGFFIGFICSIDGLFGVVGAAAGGYFVYSHYNTEVQDIQKIREMKK